MKWYWKVRCYVHNGGYHIRQIATDRNLLEIDIIQDFYKTFTGCKMLLEGMSEEPFLDTPPIDNFAKGISW